MARRSSHLWEYVTSRQDPIDAEVSSRTLFILPTGERRKGVR